MRVISDIRAQKAAAVAELHDKLDRAQAAVLTDFRGMNVAQANKLRRQLREAGVEFRVVKNSLVWRAAQEVNLDDLEEHLVGPTAIAFGYEDPVAPAREIQKFIREERLLEVKAGILDGRVISPADVKALAELPSREELLGKVAGGLTSPLSGLVGSLQALLRGFAQVIDGVRQQREAEA